MLTNFAVIHKQAETDQYEDHHSFNTDYFTYQYSNMVEHLSNFQEVQVYIREVKSPTES